MYPNTRRGPGRGTALLAVLQAILLLSALVLAPAAVIASRHCFDTEPPAEASTRSTPANASAVTS